MLGFETFKFYVSFNTSRVMSTTARARRNLRDTAVRTKIVSRDNGRTKTMRYTRL